MKLRTIAAAAAAAGALALGTAALAQETTKPQPKEQSAQDKEHRGAHQRGMHGMREMRGGCHGEQQEGSAAEHKHS